MFKPSHSWTVSGTCANPRTHPTSSIVDQALLHISRVPGSCRTGKWMAVVEGKTGLGMALVAQGLRVNLPVQGAWVLFLVGELRSHMP